MGIYGPSGLAQRGSQAQNLLCKPTRPLKREQLPVRVLFDSGWWQQGVNYRASQKQTESVYPFRAEVCWKMRNYTARAAVQFGAVNQWSCRDCLNMSTLPIYMGDFRLEGSPNARIYFGDVIGFDPELEIDQNYPISPLLVELEGEAVDAGSLVALVDREFEAFELLLRLFQPGSISVRRHGFVRDAETGRMWVSWNADPLKPNVAPLYATSEYHIHDDNIWSFHDFFNKYSDAMPRMGAPVQLALSRFNSSYERRELVDRLIDLVIALEALFNDGDPGSVTFKVALRGACWLKPPGDERVSLFQAIKKAYSTRSAAVHARSRNDPTDEQLDELEDTVRACLVKYLERKIQNKDELVGNALDNLILVGRE